MKVKICGIQNSEAALQAKKLGADAVGFVFANSKRQITAEQAERISEQLKQGPLKVGVFVNEPLKAVQEIAEQASLDIIQLHGDEPEEYARKLHLPVIKAFRYDCEVPLSAMFDYPADFILLDSPKGPYRGGNGTPFDWSSLEGQWLDHSRLILAGGLNSDNIEAAIQQVWPYGVDVSSGVESDGAKDVKKMKAFIEKAKGACK
ncbi:phosphoribosylanthranilate isomerase [Bacillus xiapuensis]|uniref:phosphoribosylanthranilate isomerase n=1 Tax=Bacillus xiapuensis TaxID=2014075 RepID=UPI000C236DE5|nr:phosphoribosylanthranilate isomerase [Bacillus xiapuensis]